MLDFSLVPAAELLHNCLVWHVGATLKYFLPQQMQGARRKVEVTGVNLVTAMVDAHAHGQDGNMYRATAAEVQHLHGSNLAEYVEMDEDNNMRLTEAGFASLRTGFPVSKPTAIMSLQRDNAEPTQMTLLELACALEQGGWERRYWSHRGLSPEAYRLGGCKVWYAKRGSSLSVWYLRALFVAEKLFELGVDAVQHCQNVSWYRSYFDKDGRPQKPPDNARGGLEEVGGLAFGIEGDSGLLESGISVSGERPLKRKRHRLSSVSLPGLGIEVRQDKRRALILESDNGAAAPLEQGRHGDTATTCDVEAPDVAESIFVAEPSFAEAEAEAVVEQEPTPAAPPIDIVAVQAGQDSFDFISSAGHRFHFVFKLNKTGTTSLGHWQCTCHYHDPVVLSSGSKTLCTSSRAVRTGGDHDAILRWLQHWAEEAEQATSKEEHQQLAVMMRQEGRGGAKKKKAPQQAPAPSSSWTPGQPASSSAGVSASTTPGQLASSSAGPSTDMLEPSNSTARAPLSYVAPNQPEGSESDSSSSTSSSSSSSTESSCSSDADS